jgi:beta-lactamase superfamily II metal-dependent hydrolase
MKLRIFQSAHGDCLLLQATGHNILCDGGLTKSMRTHVRQPLAELVTENGGKLDAIYVSHIDQDHISGVLDLLRDAIEWRVYDYHQGNGDPDVKEPKVPRPPEISALWHNSFRDQVGENVGEIGNLLAAAAPVLRGTGLETFIREAHEIENIATSIKEALEVSQYANPDFLNIPVNVLPGDSGPGGLLFREEDNRAFSIGPLKLTLVGPSKKALEDLREGWNNWLESEPGVEGVKKVRQKIREQLERFAAAQLDGSPFDLHSWNGIKSFKGVTAPNVASLVFMVEESGKRILMTGDAQQDKLLEDLEATGHLDEGHCHLNVLKVAHHGSEHNTDKNFAKTVSADHYVFCGDGSNGNPEAEAIEIYYRSRLGSSTRRALAPEAEDRPFTFWFSTNSEDLPSDSRKRKNFEKTEALVEKLVEKSNGMLRAEYVRRNYRTLTV